MISKKVILTGSFGVGKTSLFNKFIHNKFSDKYLTTIGVKVNKKTVMADGKEVSLLLWDIAGEVSQEKVPTSFYLGASAIIFVFDLTRPSTYNRIAANVDYLKGITNDAVIKIVGNKNDLVDDNDLEVIKNDIELPWNILTSAKTGDNVDELFHSLAKNLAV